MNTNIEDGIERTPHGYRVRIRVRGQLHQKRFPVTATLPHLRAWRDERRRSSRLTAPPLLRGTLAADVPIYLRAVASMPTLADRTRDCAAWVAVFGHRARWTLTPLEIKIQLEAWRARGLAASTCNHRRTALSHLFTTLEPGGPNPVAGVRPFRQPDTIPHAIPAFTIRRIFKAMPKSKTKARLEALAWTGLRPCEFRRLTPDDLNLRAKLMTITTASKRGRPRVVPLTAPAVRALAKIATLHAWGPFSLASARKSLHLACKKIDVPLIRIYDLRHSFLTLVAEASGDERAVQQLAGHTKVETTQRYTLGSVNPRLARAMAAAGRKLR